ncbi:hypothetical protein [Bordetella genomosp. 13]|uniref:hypothetical protein n=1 Tax=Bordetella genomosp. 13 TaxID=463040 RepID=UPI0011A7E0A4|nr:hypothetical protein [Bordetella genomosp. 13]
MSRRTAWTVAGAAVVALLAAGGWWAATQLDREDDRPREIPFFSDSLHVTQELVHRLGAKVVLRDGFDPETPQDARMVVRNFSYDLESEQLHFLSTWVLRGGHLVVFGSLDEMHALPELLLRDVDELPPDENPNPGGWTDADEREKIHPPADAASSEQSSESASGARAGRPPQGAQSDASEEDESDPQAMARSQDSPIEPPDASFEPDDPEDEPVNPGKAGGKAPPSGVVCRTLAEVWPEAGTYDQQRTFNVCGWRARAHYIPLGDRDPTWALQGEDGIEMMRIPVGRGSVTLMGTQSILSNGQALVEDNPLVMAAALQVRPDSEVWFVYGNVEPSRKLPPSIGGWLLEHAWVAVVIALLAAVAAVWRSATRFGPVLPPGQAHRRSMGDQVRGTGLYLRGQGAASLHAAQLRALHEAAARVLPQYATLKGTARVDAIARAADLEHEALDRAMAPLGNAGKDGRFENELALLESARRRLLARAAQARASKSSPST